MTLYMLFGGLGILIYTGVAFAEAAVSGFSSAQISYGPQFAFFVSLSMLLAIDIFFNANPLLRVDRPLPGEGASSSSHWCCLRAVSQSSLRQPENPAMP